jgi:hypothetical protein
VPKWAFPAVTVASILIGVSAIVRGTRAIQSAADSDLTNFFFKSAEYILRGDPLHIYAVSVNGYPNYNPPLSIFLMAPLLKLAQIVGFAKNYGEQITFVTLPFIVLVPLLGYLVVRALRMLYPGIPDIQLLLAYMLVTLSPLTWQSIATWYHVEQPLMLCLLVGAVLLLQRQRPGLAGVLAGLAVLSRTTALMPLIALGVLLLVAREWRTLLTFAGAGVAVVGAAMAPFFLAYPSETKYSLLTWRSGAPIGGNTIWAIFGYTGTNHLLHLADSAARRLDMYTVVLFILVVAYLATRRLRVSAYGTDAWALMAVASLAVPMLSKTNWPYYYLEPFIFLLVWEFASMHDRVAGVWRWPVLAFSFLAVTATLSQYVGLRSVGFGDRVLVGITSSGAMLVFVFAIWARMGAKKPVAAASAERANAGAGWQGIPLSIAGAPAPTIGTTARVPAPNLPGATKPNGATDQRNPLWPQAPSDPWRPAQGLWPPELAGPSQPLSPRGDGGGQRSGQPAQWPDLPSPGSGWPQRQ